MTFSPTTTKSPTPSWTPSPISTTAQPDHSFRLSENYFYNLSGTPLGIDYWVENDEWDVSLRIFGADGALVRKVLNAPGSIGPHSITWDGTDAGGHAVYTGVYTLALTKKYATEKRNLLVIHR